MVFSGNSYRSPIKLKACLLVFLIVSVSNVDVLQANPTYSPSAQDIAESEWQTPESALPLVVKGREEEILSGQQQILSGVDESISGGSGRTWKLDDPSARLMQAKLANGLKWEVKIQTDAAGVVHFINQLSLSAPAQKSVTIAGYTFAATTGNMGWDGFSVENMRMLCFPTQYHNFKIGEFTPYGVFDSSQHQKSLHIYFPNWLDSSGTIQFFPPMPVKETPVLFRLNLKNPDGHRPLFTLQPGTTRQWEIRLGLFPLPPVPVSLGEKDIQLYGNKNYRGDFFRRELLTMGFPLPAVPAEKAGHFFTMIPDEKALAMIPLLAKAGTQFIVFQSPDFADISQGVSWQGDYNQAPPLLAQLVATAHENGIKVLWWFSIHGVLRDGGRNQGRGSPLLQEHPDWFVKAFYWHNLYQHTDMTSPGWKNWVLEKITHDQNAYDLDGFAFDEPYFNGTTLANGQTNVRNGYDFLQAISEKIHSSSRPQIMIGNYWAPQDDEWKFFDYMMLEASDFMRLQDTTMGRHTAGHTFQASLFKFKIILNQLAYNLADYDQSIGWSSPDWYFKLTDAKKTPDQIAQLLSYSGAWHRVWAAEVQAGLRQIEIVRNDEHGILLCNVGDTEIDNFKFQPVSFQAIGSTADATTDTSTAHQEFKIARSPTPDGTFLLKSLPPQSITAINFAGK